MKVEVTCCEGKDEFGCCLKGRCPLYVQAQQRIQSAWPYVGTGFGNLYGDPTHQQFLSGVRKDIQVAEKQED